MAEPHVLVIGGGLAGTTAALTLADAGIQTTLASAQFGATAQFSGVWQLGCAPGVLADGGAEVAVHLQTLARHELQHPYGRLGAEPALAALTAGWRLVTGGLAPRAQGDALPDLALVPHVDGTLQPGIAAVGVAALPLGSDLPPPGTAAAGLRLLVDLGAWGAPLSPRAAVGWAHDAPRMASQLPPFRHVRIEAPSELPEHAQASELGLMKWLEDSSSLDLLAQALKAQLRADVAEVWLPSVLGSEPTAPGRAALERALGRPVFEVASKGGRAAAAWRRLRALSDKVAAANIGRCGRIASCELEGARPIRATLEAGGTLDADAVVLATGRFLGGGWRWPSQQRASERLLGLPLSVAEMPLRARTLAEVTMSHPQMPQPFLQLGLQVSGALNPCCSNESRQRQLAAVFCAGDALGGADADCKQASDGIALATGYTAAQGILARLRGGP